MGYGPARLLWQVELPLALPSVMTGLRIATVSTVALVTVGVIVGQGGLGQIIIVNGFGANYYRPPIVFGTLACVLLAFVADQLLSLVQRLLTPWARTRVTRMNAFGDALLYLNDPLNWTRPRGIIDLTGQHVQIAGLALIIGAARRRADRRLARAHRPRRRRHRGAGQHLPRRPHPGHPRDLRRDADRLHDLGAGHRVERLRRSRRSSPTPTSGSARSTATSWRRLGPWG